MEALQKEGKQTHKQYYLIHAIPNVLKNDLDVSKR